MYIDDATLIFCLEFTTEVRLILDSIDVAVAVAVIVIIIDVAVAVDVVANAEVVAVIVVNIAALPWLLPLLTLAKQPGLHMIFAIALLFYHLSAALATCNIAGPKVFTSPRAGRRARCVNKTRSAHLMAMHISNVPGTLPGKRTFCCTVCSPTCAQVK